MKGNFTFIKLLLLIFCIGGYMKAQEAPEGIIRCGTTEYEKQLQQNNPKRATEEEFEKWIQPKIKKMQARLKNGKLTEEVLIIPVVVHVIHQGTAVGVGANLSEERILSQIEVLNQDYRRKEGTPGYNNDPRGADVGIEFRLAKVDRDGNLFNGINRVQYTGTWTQDSFNNTVKPNTYWDPDKYFNIWTTTFGGADQGLLGYAQFPSNSGLEGMFPPYDSQSDGVVINWEVFGTSDIVPATSDAPYMSPYDKGRTLTHEMGHALGLRHIWGDHTVNSCNQLPIIPDTDSNHDYCPDTPATYRSYFYCQKGTSSCQAGVAAMVENYMDYSDDYCFNIFTQDQKMRMRTVMQNSPRRKSLLTSNVLSYEEVETRRDPVSIYPNPAINELNINFPNLDELPLEYKIYSNVGSLIEEGVMPQQTNFKVNTSGYSAGVYLLVVKTDKGTHKFKFIVKK